MAKGLLSLLDDVHVESDDENDDSSDDRETLDQRHARLWESNVLHEMVDDLEFMTWCHGAVDRARDAVDAWEGGGQLFDEDTVKPWEVSKPFIESPARVPNGNHKKWTRSSPTRQDTDSDPPTSPASTDDDADGEDEDTDEEDWEPYDARRFFTPDNSLGEALLPVRLPQALIRRTSGTREEMERIRATIHRDMNDVAGLQKRMIQLIEFVELETVTFDLAIEKQGQRQSPSLSF